MGTPFISRGDLSDYIGRDVSTDDGATIAVDSVCELIRTLTEQDLDLATETVTLDGTGTDVILLPQLPVASAGTVLVNGGTITDYCLNGNGMLIRGTAGQRWSFSSVWPTGRQNVQITYTHGYTSVPEDLRELALAAARRKVLQGPASYEQMGQNQIRYSVGAGDLDATEKLIIEKYRRHY